MNQTNKKRRTHTSKITQPFKKNGGGGGGGAVSLFEPNQQKGHNPQTYRNPPKKKTEGGGGGVPFSTKPTKKACLKNHPTPPPTRTPPPEPSLRLQHPGLRIRIFAARRKKDAETCRAYPLKTPCALGKCSSFTDILAHFLPRKLRKVVFLREMPHFLSGLAAKKWSELLVLQKECLNPKSVKSMNSDSREPGFLEQRPALSLRWLGRAVRLGVNRRPAMVSVQVESDRIGQVQFKLGAAGLVQLDWSS